MNSVSYAILKPQNTDAFLQFCNFDMSHPDEQHVAQMLSEIEQLRVQVNDLTAEISSLKVDWERAVRGPLHDRPPAPDRRSHVEATRL